jgi:hypothetical protein
MWQAWDRGEERERFGGKTRREKMIRKTEAYMGIWD